MGRTARPYQLAQNEAVREAFRKGIKHVIVEAPTGSGKTVTFVLMSKMATDKKNRVLILLNRNVLIEQTLAELKENGLFAYREQAQHRAPLTADAVCASIQSLDGKWLERFPRDHFKLVLCDEVHGSAAATFKRILDHFDSAYHVGFTATPERHDKRGLWKGYSDIVWSMALKEAIDQGWLCGFEFTDLECPVTVDLKIAKKANISESEEVFDSALYLPRLADCAIAESQGRKGLFFLPNCRVSAQFADMLCARGMNAKHIDSSYMSKEETKSRLAWFAAQETGILCNADLLSVGYNRPEIDLIGLFRPIASTPMYKQRLGRGTRPIAPIDLFDTPEARREAISSSNKPFCKVLNVFWENGGHDLASPSCLITDDEEEQRELDKKRKPGAKVDLAQMELQLKASKEMKDQAEEMRKFAEKVANSQAQAQSQKKKGELFVGHILRMKHNGNDASSGQMFYLRKLGYKHTGEPLSKQQAYLITETYKRQKETAV